jgi:hypothetical protein
MDEREFRQYTQKAFTAMTEEYALCPLPASAEPFPNPFEARFANTTTIITVEGINYGFGVDVRLASTNSKDMVFRTYCFDDLLAIRAPEFEHIMAAPDDTNEIQKKQIAAYAGALPKYADDVLRGDFTIFPQLARAIEERQERYDLEMADLSALAMHTIHHKPWWKFW